MFLIKCLSPDGKWQVSLTSVDAEIFSGEIIDLNTHSSSSWTFDRSSDKFSFTDLHSLPQAVTGMLKEFIYGPILNIENKKI